MLLSRWKESIRPNAQLSAAASASCQFSETSPYKALLPFLGRNVRYVLLHSGTLNRDVDVQCQATMYGGHVCVVDVTLSSQLTSSKVEFF